METPGQLVGRQVLRNFGKQGIHKGTITSFDDDGELTFRVEYEDGDEEDLDEGDIRDTLIDKGIVRVASRSQRQKEAEDSESDYFPEETGSHKQVKEVTTSQATTQPFEFPLSEGLSQTITITASAVPITVSRKRSSASVRQQSSSVVWVRSPCPKAINVHFNAVDRGLCAQTLREHHTILERAMGRLYPRTYRYNPSSSPSNLVRIYI
jgi:hypothetical protein